MNLITNKKQLILFLVLYLPEFDPFIEITSKYLSLFPLNEFGIFIIIKS